ncbi:MAG: anti-sigma factor [Gemmatimonadetes bacterium]|jgi:hypothetical protein|nr:anti-sigma factor [Gemmatimonadota bacterium]
MNCSDYVANFSDFLDGTAPADEIRLFEAHVEGCADCRRYREVVQRGSEVLRMLPEPELTEDFAPRLRRRLYQVPHHGALASGASATPAMTVVGMAILLTAIAWSPALKGVPQIEMAPIVVDRPAPRRPTSLPFRPVNAMPADMPERRPLADLEGGLWDDSQALMYEYSPLSQRYRQRAAVRGTGTDRDR